MGKDGNARYAIDGSKISMTTNQSIRIEPANKNDIPLILKFIKELAEYEHLSDQCVATEDLLREALFGEKKFAEVVIAYYHDEPAGFELFFHNFSTFVARPGIYLEDLYVFPHFRGKGIGKALLVYLARIAKERNCGRFEWAVLDWNEPSIAFYKKLGAIPLNDWTTFRVTGEALDSLARNSP
jgi:GNAT superfamily N-acetyltransferase